MRGKKAKALRKLAYGDESSKQDRVYVSRSYERMFMNKMVTVTTVENAPESPRALYQKSKKD